MVESLGLPIIVIGTLKLPKELQRFTYDSLTLPDNMLISFQAVYKQDPDLTREGGSIPVTLTFAESLGVNVLLLPMGRGDDGAQ